MIKFFRKIRQKLLSENKISRYIIYAAGEVILVVIGILIALYINNHNQDKNNRLEEQALLKSLRIELSQNQEQLTEKIKYIDLITNRDSTFLTDIINPISKRTYVKLDSVAGQLGIPSTYNPSQGVIKTIINSGKLGIIENAELKNQLSSMEGKIDDLNSINNDISDFLNISVNPYLYQNYSLSETFLFPIETPKVDINRKAIIEDKIFINIVIKHWEINSVMKNKLKNIYLSNKRMMDLIEDELKK